MLNTPWKLTKEMATTNEQTADEVEIEQTSKSFGRLFVLMDGIFSDFNVSKDEYHYSIIPRLENKLKILLQEWIRMNLSITPKLHILLNHAIFQLAHTRGFADMREDRIERSHQDRMKNDSRLACIRNRNARMNSQAK